MELTYHRKGDYLFPNLTVEEEEVTIGKYGMLRRTFLKEHKNSLYQSLFLTGKLNSHLAEIEKAAQVRALLADVLDLPVDAEHVLTHAEVGDLDGYGPDKIGTEDFEKWDLWQLPDYDGEWREGGDVLRGKANWYLNGPSHNEA